MPTPFETYLADIQADFKVGKATEYTYRSALEHLLESLAPHIEASNDPKHIKCGAPDFIVERRKVPLGYVETKDVGDDLAKTEKSDQLKRYRASLNNLILTDYLEFRWYVNGTHRLTARIAEIGTGHKLTPSAAGLAKAEQLFQQFYQTETPIVVTPKDLAQRMAALTQIVRDLIVGALREESDTGVFHKQCAAFQQQLLPALTPGEFADLYAQTMAYGLFAARINAPAGKPFDRAQAYVYLPQANPFLRRLFLDVGEELDDTPIAPFLDDLAALLARADMAEIQKNFGRRTRTEDPVVHFYQTFLAAYDPKMRQSRGVYYTPEPAVDFIVASIDALLKRVFNRPLGLADPEVFALDPATGTATFIYALIRCVHRTLAARGQLGTWQDYVHDHLLPRIFGFELLMAPYAVAHLKLGLLLSELGYTFGKHDRLGVFLTNTLEQAAAQAQQASLGLAGYLSEEGSAANGVKNQKQIMVVLGNPPYSNFGMMNKGAWIRELLEDYKKDLNEKKINLDDDFIKFIRFGQWRIDQTGQGILAFITSNTYIDGITHRRMRQSLMESFTDIYILDLHGSSKKQEVAPDGSKDENVFDIQQGVAISIFVKEPGKHGPAKVHFAELWGSRENKYEVLSSTDIWTTKWMALEPEADYFFFVPRNVEGNDEYAKYVSLREVMPEGTSAVQTKRDALFVDFEKTELRRRMKEVLDKGLTDEVKRKYPLEESPGWSPKRMVKARFSNQNVRSYLYRPFDYRFIYYDDVLLGRSRIKVFQHLLQPNLALATLRQTVDDEFRHVFCTTEICDINLVIGHHVSDQVFPLYLYTTPEDTQGTLWAQSEVTRTPNLAPDFIKDFSGKLGLTFVQDGQGDLKKTFGPEDVFHYIYAVFHSPTYRTRYAEFLKIDFPRVPLTGDVKLFRKLVALGAELVDLHLMRSPKLNDFITTYPVSGNGEVIKVRFEKRRVWINDMQYFGGVPDDIWNFKVGGYQVCDKWLKDRKGRTLSNDDITHYQRIVVALSETRRIMAAIDKAISSWPLV